MIELEGVSFVPVGADRPILADVSLRIAAGERVGIVGPSGAGKSTLGYHLCGAHRLALAGETTGVLRYDGADGTEGAPCGFAGLVGQNPEAQLFCRTVYEELALALRVRGEDETRCAAVADALLDRYAFGARRDAPVSKLSLGQKQLTAVLSMLAMEPRVLLLDEPTSYLDAAAADRLFAHLGRLCRCHGWIVLVIEHDLARLSGFAERVLSVADGRLVADGPFEAHASDGDPAMAAPLPPFAPVDAAGEPAVAFSDLSFAYAKGEPVLRDIDLAVRPGESVALLGPNGVGKSTLLRLAKGLSKPGSGTVRLGEGLLPSRDVGLMFQNPEDQIFAHTVEAECGYWLANLGVPREERSRRCGDVLAGLGLSGMDERAPFSLSFGEKRRLCLAAVLVAGPAVLCLDEPTTGLDDANMVHMAGIVRRLAGEGKAILFATHEGAFAAMAATRWVRLEEGRIVSDGPNPHLTSHDRHA
ncbi:ABC transporter related protein [Solidesulfovibrio fructosivorans JJ]]|uniref:ABC transporter related protein n=1 Tax=Solidesulfovibrio fructosivorans JJ] TaxID=596151 RepID=E1JVK8_SOLFR|nr:ABC transporter ATP-binding protein [Solidesulfovibrio fructosivorans]EFL51496.1 ABC transporter related protein [Solidesulfovibrio fructosivorans JJ]]